MATCYYHISLVWFVVKPRKFDTIHTPYARDAHLNNLNHKVRAKTELETWPRVETIQTLVLSLILKKHVQ